MIAMCAREASLMTVVAGGLGVWGAWRRMGPEGSPRLGSAYLNSILVFGSRALIFV